MVSFVFARRLVLAAWVVSVAAAAQAAEPQRILSNWFAQPDQGGYWQAQVDRLGADAGIEIAVQQGGPKIQTIPQVASGQAEFGIGNADDVLLARLRGAPVRAVFAPLDHVPYALVYHADPAVRTIADLQGRTFAVSLGSAYWEWLKKKYALAGVREIPVSGDLSLFRNDPRMVQQGYSLYLPARMQAAGLAVQQIRVADLGYRPYSVLFTTDDMIRRHPERVRAVVAAAQKGWAAYLADPSRVQALVASLNPQMAPEIQAGAVREMAERLVAREPARIGCMSDARWTELATQLSSAGFLPGGFDPKSAYDRGFVPGCLP